MYSVLFPGVFFAGFVSVEQDGWDAYLFLYFPSGLLIHGGPHKDSSAGSARAEKFTYLASSFIQLLSAIKLNT